MTQGPVIGQEALAIWAAIKVILLAQAREEGQTTEVTNAIVIIESSLGITSQPT
jgi:hypothetical protein